MSKIKEGAEKTKFEVEKAKKEIEKRAGKEKSLNSRVGHYSLKIVGQNRWGEGSKMQETQRKLEVVMSKIKEGAEKTKFEVEKAKKEFEKRAGKNY